MKVMLFGAIAELAGSATVDVEARSIGQLRRALADRLAGLDRWQYAIAVNREVIHEDIPLSGSEEIAVLPPFAGG
jgi:molybdopterin synthase sulfur carrier subunit